MADTILKRGETLDITVTFQDSETGENVNATTEDGYAIAGYLSNVNGGSELYDLAPTLTNGVGRISYDTENLAAGRYFWDIRLTLDTGEEVWNDSQAITIKEPITKPA